MRVYWIFTKPKDQLLAGHETEMIGFDAGEPVQQSMAQGDFVAVYCLLETTRGTPLIAFTGLGRTADTPGQTQEDPRAINRRFFSAFDLPFAKIRKELEYPKDLPQ